MSRAMRECASARVLVPLLTALALAGCSQREPEQQAQPVAPPKAERAAPTKAEGTRDSRGKIETVDNYRVIHARTKDGESAAIKVQPPKGWDIVQLPSEPDPHGGEFTLSEATKGLPKKGELAAHIKTSMGSFYCDLFDDKAPIAVANFIGLARGLRKFWDSEARAWVSRPYYAGTTFHRVIPGFMIQGGDHTGTGRGGLGYKFADEVAPGLRHDRPGQLCMANRGPNTNEAQFFITDGAAPHLDGSYTIFGQCEPATLVQRIARVPQAGRPSNRPLTPVTIDRVEIRRLAGGAQKWMPQSAKLPPLPELPGRAVEVKPPGTKPPQ